MWEIMIRTVGETEWVEFGLYKTFGAALVGSSKVFIPDGKTELLIRQNSLSEPLAASCDRTPQT
jgi:hypothetical protein